MPTRLAEIPTATITILLHNTETYTLFFELLQVAIGKRSSLSRTPSPEEWEQLYTTAKEQTLAGIAFAALERLPHSQLPPPRRIRQWAVKADRIRELNRQASRQTAAVWRYFKDNGFHCLILKGQGNAANYPEHLCALRSPGDIDVWAWPQGSHHVRTVIEFCQSRKKGEFMYYHNMDFPILKDIPVEVHYRPTWLYNPLHNHRLQQWLSDYKHSGQSVEFEGYAIPTAQFNAVFQLLHLYKHIFEEGIGMRQLLDYYMVLQQSSSSMLDTALIKSFGLERFASAVMYVLQQVFCNDASPDATSWMPYQPDERAGRQLLSEIMLSGNFGQSDKRYNWAEVTNGSLRYRGLPYAMARLRHNLHFLASYPSEVIFEPPFRIYNKLWLTLRLWRYE